MDESTPLKRCSHCRQYKLASKEHFTTAKTKDGWHNMCRECYNERARERAKSHKLPPEGTVKHCPKCGNDKPATLDFFSSHRRSIDHLYYICRECNQTGRRKPPKYAAPEGYKRCPQCGEAKPTTFEFFHRRWKDRDALYPWCKLCVHRYGLEHYKPRVLPDETNRTCTRCWQAYPATPQYFYRNKNGVNGLTALCKRCIYRWGVEYRQRAYKERQEYMRRWHEQNREHTREYSRKYYHGHIEQARTRWNRYSRANSEAIRQTRKQYYAAHRDQLIAKTRERRKIFTYPSESVEYRRSYYRTHREYYIAKAHQRRARIRAIPGTHTAQDEREQYQRQRGKCYYCRKKVKWGQHHLDHTIPISRPHARNSIDYLVVTCKRCNLRKGNKYPHEWPEGGRLL